jgi:hypothetical protein
MDITQIIIATINPFFALISLMFTGFMTYLSLNINRKVDDAKKVNDATHTLVNSNMGIQLKIAMGLAARIAELTKKPQDIADAAETKRIYDEHMKKQSVVDSYKIT